MSKYLNEDGLLDLSNVPRVFPFMVIYCNAIRETCQNTVEFSRKTTSDKLAYSISRQLDMNKGLDYYADVMLLEKGGWRPYNFVFFKGENGEAKADVIPISEWSSETCGRQKDVEWCQVKFDRWTQFPFVDWRKLEDGYPEDLVDFWMEAQSNKVTIT